MRLLSLALLSVALAGAGEAPSDPGREAFLAAVARAPAVAAARVRTAAAVRDEDAAGVLPDPMVGFDLGRERPRMGEDMDMYGAMLEQPLPRWGERDAMRLGARARTALASAGQAGVLGELAAMAATALAEAEAAGEQLTLTRRMRERVGAMQEAMRARTASGSAMLGDALALTAQAERLDLQLADLARRQADAAAEARALLALSDEAPLPPFAAPDPAVAGAGASPMAQEAAAMRLEAQAMEREAVARGNPETVLGVVWEREAAGTMEQTDKVSLAVRLSLPVHRGAYHAAADAARARARAAGHEERGANAVARSRFSRAERAAAQAVRAQRTADDLAERGRRELDALTSRLGTGETTVTMALDLLDRIDEAGMGAIMARLDARMARAELWRIAPPNPPKTEETGP